MPEGDTIHRAARRLQAIVGETLEVEAPHPRARAAVAVDRLDGRRLEHVEAIGKNLLFRFAGGVVLRSHLRMSGRWTVRPRGQASTRRPWLILRGTKTLTVRMERTNENAQIIAEYLDAHPKVTRTIYPGLKSHPHYALAKKQMRGFGGLISFDVGSLDNAKTFLNRVRLMALAESLGGVETLISHPAIMTHASVPRERRSRALHRSPDRGRAVGGPPSFLVRAG